MAAFQQMEWTKNGRLFLFTGPFMPENAYDRLYRQSNDGIQVTRFTSDFISYLAAADLSVSMAGYNTCMNLLAAEVPALVWPFEQNREQRLRAERLSVSGLLRALEQADLNPARLAAIMDQTLSKPPPSRMPIDLCGSTNTARWIEDWVSKRLPA